LPTWDENQSQIETETSPGRVIGTAAYMSPEQAAGRPVDEHTDQFAIGLLLYEMLAGVPAFHEETVAEILTAILRHEPAALSNLRPDTPAPLAWIVERCLAKEPSERYAATADLARDLRHLQIHLNDLQQTTTSARDTPVTAHRRTLLPWILVSMLALVSALTLLRPWNGAERPAASGVKRLSLELPAGH